MVEANKQRRRFLGNAALFSASALLSMNSSFGHATQLSDVNDLELILQEFLKEAFVPPSLQCGARLGDGVPPHDEVIAFMSDLQGRTEENSQQTMRHLLDLKHLDYANDQFMVIDGWVLARTEALAASSFVLLTKKNCQI